MTRIVYSVSVVPHPAPVHIFIPDRTVRETSSNHGEPNSPSGQRMSEFVLWTPLKSSRNEADFMYKTRA